MTGLLTIVSMTSATVGICAILCRLSSKINFVVHCILYILCFVTISIYGVTIAILFKLTNREHLVHLYTGRTFSRLVCFFLRLKIQVINETVFDNYKNKTFVLACNHQSVFDVTLMGRITPLNCAVMVKESLKYMPFFGVYLKSSEVIFINRKNKKSAIQTSSSLAKKMIEKQIGVYIYVEGTRSGLDKPGLLPFKKGPFHIALNAKADIIPVVFCNTTHIFDFKNWTFNSGTLYIEVLEPIKTNEYSPDSISQLIDKTKNGMLNSLEKLYKKTH